jgi:exopolysaccharide biosynthesis polyprenyl glycosylphosphotransferase
MLQRDRQIRTQVHQFADACLFAASFWLAYIVRSNPIFTPWLGAVPPEMLLNVWWLYIVLIPAAPLVLESQGFYNRPAVNSRRTLIRPLLLGSVLITIGIVLILFYCRVTAPRGVLLIFIVFSCALVWLKEEILMAALRSPMAKAQYRRRVIVAGAAMESNRLRQLIKASGSKEIEVVAEFNLAEASTARLIELLHEHSASSVMVSAKHTNFERVENVIRVCEIEGVEAWLVADFFAPQIARASFDEIFGHPLIVFRSAPESSWQMVAKQLLDFTGALLALLIFAPLMLGIAALIKLTSPGPVMFRQQRSGLNGSPFSIFKFRTMMTNAEQFKHELAAMNEMSGPVFKVTNDPRITPVGRWLRKFSLDELPQLFNVLHGEMSLVGPRPLPVDEVKRFNDLAHRRRLSVKPGLTCLWQISGRNQITDFKDWVRLDLQYIDNWSIWLDLTILLRTVPVVLLGTGAK